MDERMVGMLVLAAIASAAPAVVGGPGCVGSHAEPCAVTREQPGRDTLRSPPVLSGHENATGAIEFDLVAASARVSLIPGSETAVYAYNGRVPGPTLELREGDDVVIRFRNELPEATTVHWHGLHIPFNADGSPFHPVEAGGEYEYRFRVPEGSAGTYWYHPHPHHHTAWQVGMGLYGAVIIRAADDPLAGIAEKLLILSDNRFLPDGSLDFPTDGTAQAEIDALNGREGDVLFVNDAIRPVIPLRPGEVQRWRVINASGARVYRLALSGHAFVHVGSDGGLFERPVEVDEIILANGERAELLVRGTAGSGARATLQALPYDRYMARARPTDWNRTLDLLHVEYDVAFAAGTGVGDEAALPFTVPSTLRAIPVLERDAATVTRRILMSQGRLNGRTMALDRVDISAELGTTEIWEVENLVGMDHPFHLHGFQFQVLERNGEPEPFASWKDTVNVPKRESVRFIVRYTDHAGRWMFHCHILDHEDQGMMGVLEVRSPEPEPDTELP
jgi:FtsP/CotA-like multicopper oxidase with cupredoxin domain